MRRAQRQDRAVQALRAGATRTAAAQFAGISRRAFYDWLADTAFARRVEDAESAFLVDAAGRIYRAGYEGEVSITTRPDGTVTERRRPGDWKALAWLLERRRPEDYGEPKHRVAVEHKDVTDGLDDHELDLLQAAIEGELARRGELPAEDPAGAA